ncbi:hypothetical protein ApAK_03020 [Thermoplasmatales archaeon AK]|nr:hypothetical protein [Thermoplasmatales archaeon AK]
MNTRTRVLIFTSLGHFTNDSTSMLFPVLITYYVLLPNVSILFLGSSAIILNVISGLISTPIGSLADRTDHDALLIAAGIVILGVSGFILALPFRFESLTVHRCSATPMARTHPLRWESTARWEALEEL